ncbi:MAG: hypothetical protein CMC76_09865 [Flavobacteriaceae bacterium]|nr:hypothetical protein [Flavobacteriaceae bacterium]|tara:strand:- start:2673 stop:3185 length:513 start_codon:yes stop_codon:yes gene_type:complete
MTEIERIKNNNNLELPVEKHEYIIVENIGNPEEALNTFKQSMLAILENKNVPWDSPKWDELFPKEVVAFTNQLQEEDYKDELLSHLSHFVDDVRDVRSWEWYSSQLYEDGFEVVILDEDRKGMLWSLLHHQGIPHANLFSGDDKTKLSVIKAGLDVLTYKTWNPETLELK